MAAINHPYGGARRSLPRRLAPAFPRIPAPNWWAVGAVTVLCLGAVLPVVQNSTATTRGFEIQALQVERSNLSGSIRALESQVATYTSLDRVQRRALEMGLHPPAEPPIWVEVGEAGPAPAKIPADLLPAPVSQPGGSESWWRSLLSVLPSLPGQ